MTLSPRNLSFYYLTFESQTRIFARVKDGVISVVKSLIKIVLLALVSIGMLFGTGPSAQANTITNITYTFPSAATEWSGDVYFPRLFLDGTLNSVKLQVDTSWNVVNSITNANPAHQDAPGTYAITALTLGQLGSSLFPDFPINAVVTGSTVTVLYGTHYDQTISTNLSFSHTYTSSLGEFLGRGSVDLNVDLQANATDHTTKVGESGGLISEAAGLTITLTYDYSGVIVPEPSTAILFGIGGLMCCGYGWRRRMRRTTVG